MTPRPFRIEIPDDALDDLRDRLARTRWPQVLPDAGWDYGTDQAYLRAFCDYWRTGYDWRRAEARLNALPQFQVPVDGVDVHVLHVRGTGPAPMPLLLVHGWPGSVWEFLGTVDLLTDPPDPADSFDVVIASLPGFGFSSPPTERGWGPARIAAALDTVMGELGYGRYAAQGGDWGGIISAQLAADFPDRCLGIHVNQTIAAIPDPVPDDLASWKVEYDRFAGREGGYSHQQATYPDSLTVAQNDSPAGLAAWVLEKFRTWGQTNGDLDRAFRRDDLISNLMLYWLTGTAGSAARIYKEMRHDAAARAFPPVTVPTAVACFPGEPFRLPRAIVEQRYNVVRWTELRAGGHFAALEQPELLVEDVREFFRTLR